LENQSLLPDVVCLEKAWGAEEAVFDAARLRRRLEGELAALRRQTQEKDQAIASANARGRESR
jgi:hypothetical protein